MLLFENGDDASESEDFLSRSHDNFHSLMQQNTHAVDVVKEESPATLAD